MASLFRKYWGLVTAYNLVIIGSDNGLPSHYLNQCRLIMNYTLSKKLQGKFNRNTKVFCLENEFKNVACDISTPLFRSQCVSSSYCHVSTSLSRKRKILCTRRQLRVDTSPWDSGTKTHILYIWSYLVNMYNISMHFSDMAKQRHTSLGSFWIWAQPMRDHVAL